jgi:hypothetical protein
MLRTIATKAWHTDCVDNCRQGGTIYGDRAADYRVAVRLEVPAMVAIGRCRPAVMGAGDFWRMFFVAQRSLSCCKVTWLD